MTKGLKMKIVIILDEPYPNGMACSNRTHLYSKGLVELNNDVEILIPSPQVQNSLSKNFKSKGIYEGVKFTYVNGIFKRKSFLGRTFQYFLSHFTILKFLIRTKPLVVLIVSNNIKYTLVAKFYSLFHKCKLIREKTEVPFYQLQKLSRLRKLRIRTEFKLYDGLIVISKKLKKFFNNDLSINIKIEEIPIIIDTHNHNYSKTQVKEQLVYSGSLQNEKDGVLTIIKAFAVITKRYPNIKLILTGSINQSKDKTVILSLIDQLGLKEKIELTGYVTKEELKEILSTATALLLAKPRNRQNAFNMATKIGEYLMSGRPIIISSVDPATNYLQHSKSALIVDPTEKEIIEQIQFVLEKPAEANMIGLEGKKVAIQQFDYKKHVMHMNNFFNQIVSINLISQPLKANVMHNQRGFGDKK